MRAGHRTYPAQYESYFCLRRSGTFAGIEPRDVPMFIFAQLAGAALAAIVARKLFDAQ